MDSGSVAISHCFPSEVERVLTEFLHVLAPLEALAFPLHASHILSPKMVRGYLEEKMGIFADFTIKMGVDVECPILGCPIALQRDMKISSSVIVPIDEFVFLPCCWKMVSLQSLHSFHLCPFCRKNGTHIIAGTKPKPFVVGWGISRAAALLVHTAISKSETRLSLIEERLFEMRESLQEIFVREFTDDLVLLNRERMIDNHRSFQDILMRQFSDVLVALKSQL